MNKKINISIGITSVIMVFAVLIFTVFGGMSFSVAKTEADITENTVKSAKAYYQIDNECEKLLCDIDTMLFNVRKDIASGTVSYDDIENLGVADKYSDKEKNNRVYFYLVNEQLNTLKGEYDIEIDDVDDSYINVKVELIVSEMVQYKVKFNILDIEQDQRYEVISRHTYSSDGWEEEYIEVWEP